jgi:hypothetical protein
VYLCDMPTSPGMSVDRVHRMRAVDGQNGAFDPYVDVAPFFKIAPMSRDIRCPPRPNSTVVDVSRRALIAAMGSTLVSRFSFAQNSLASSNCSDFEQRMQRIPSGLRSAVASEPPMKLTDRMNELHVPGVSIGSWRRNPGLRFWVRWYHRWCAGAV